MQNPLVEKYHLDKAKQDIDPLALEITRDMNLESAKALNEAAQWEHEDLAKVRIRALRSHTKGVNRSRFFAGDTRIVSASEDCSIKIWHRAAGVVLKSMDNVHEENAADVSCNEQGDRMVSCGWDHAVHFWDMETGKHLWTHKFEDITTCCQLSADGRLVCVGTDLYRSLILLDTVSGETIQLLKDYHKSTLTSCTFSPMDNRIITSSYDTTAKLFDLRTHTNTITLEGHANVVSHCAMTRDERKFATTSWDKTVRIWDVSTGMYRSKGPDVLEGSHDGSVSSCQFSNDGLLLVTGSFDKSIVVWDVENNIQKIKLQGHLSWVTDVSISEDQCWLLSCSKDHTVRMWNIEESDNIPIVMENRKMGGLKVIKCTDCAKPFSMSELESYKDVTICVFCRQKNPDKSWLQFEDDPEV